MKINELFKHRSVTACMKESYDLMTSNPKNLVKQTWMAFLPYALLTALFLYLRMPNKFLHDWGEASPFLSFCLQSIVYLGIIVALFFVGAAMWRWITDKPFGETLKRFTLVTLCSYAVMIVVGFILIIGFIIAAVILGISLDKTVGDTGTPAHLGLFALFVLLECCIMLAIVLPFAYIIPRYMLLEEGKPMKVWQSVKTGIRHSGSIFKMGFLCGLIMMVCNIVLYLPMMILTGAQMFSQLGALDGDPVGVPSYFTPLFLIVSTLMFFVYSYVNSWILTSFVYLYGSIEHDEEDKKMMISKEITTKEITAE